MVHTPRSFLKWIRKKFPDRDPWTRDGMVCVQMPPKKVGGNPWAFEAKDFNREIHDFIAIGTGGWTRNGKLHFVGFDLDVGHGDPEQSYPSYKEALKAAREIRQYLDGAAHIRRSKSGIGIHVFVPIQAFPLPKLALKELNSFYGIYAKEKWSEGKEPELKKRWIARTLAGRIANWLANELKIKCDRSVLSRQNFWHWAKTPGKRGFDVIEEAR